MTLTPFYRRALALFAVSLLLGLVVRFWPDNSQSTVVSPSAETIAAAEKRLAKTRDVAATVPARESILKRAQAELGDREKGLLIADTAAQAQAQLLQIMRGLAGVENPPIELRSESFGIRPLGDSYGEASVGVGFDCHIDQLVNLLAGISSRPELVSTTELHINATNNKEKLLSVRLTVSAVVPRKLAPGRRS